MSMYLPNPSLHPTGSEPAEFLEVPERVADIQAAPTGWAGGATARLDLQTRLDIARRAHGYIAGLVQNHDGGPEDVRSIIHDLHADGPVVDRPGRLPGGALVERWG
jgi:hypothetical protein